MINGKSRTTEEQGQNVLTENAAKKNPKYPTIELNQSARSVERFGMCMLGKNPLLDVHSPFRGSNEYFVAMYKLCNDHTQNST